MLHRLKTRLTMNAPQTAITTSGLARKLGLTQPTVTARLRLSGITPDFVLENGERKFDAYLVSRMAELKGLISSPLRPDQAAMR